MPEIGDALEEFAEVAADPSVSDLETARGGSARLRILEGGRTVLGLQLSQGGASGAQFDVQRLAGRVGDLALGVVGNDVVFDEGIEGVLLAKVLEEVLLSPAIEHALGDLDGGKVPAGSHDGRLVATVVAEARDLA